MKKILFPAKYKTAHFLPFIFCFIRELNPYTPLTFSLRPPIHPYLTHHLRIHQSLRNQPFNPSVCPVTTVERGCMGLALL